MPAWYANVELQEWDYPVRYLRHGFFVDSGGPGKWRGGCGVMKEIEFLADADLTVRSSGRHDLPPPGLAGGESGRGGAWILNRGREDERRLPAKQTNIRVRAGDCLTAMVSGGGGYGDPLTRDPARVEQDVRAGVVSIDGARRDYSVVIDPSTGSVDTGATVLLRAG